MLFHVAIFFLLQLSNPSFANHYKGGTITWKPTNPTLISGPTVSVTITQRQSFTLSRYPCNTTTIDTNGVFNDTQPSTPATLACISLLATCLASSYQTINSPLSCIDFTTIFQVSSGTYYTTQDLAINSIIDIAWQSASWANEILTNQWSLVSHIDLTPTIAGKINTSPVTGSLPIFQTYINQTTVIQIAVGDVDYDQVFRCRWATLTPLDECGNICLDLTGATLDPIFCFITWKPVLRARDAANGLNSSTYVAAIMVEDFANASSTTPLSSVPHQVLVYVTSKPAGLCTIKPSISTFVGRRNLACYAVTAGVQNSYNFIGTVSPTCVNASIVDFVSSSPFFTNKSDIYQVSNFTWDINVTWRANINQTGLQPFCVAAVDNYGQMSNQYCVMILVQSVGTNPSFITPSFVQSTASPVGTVMITQTRFSIQATLPLRRTTLNSTFISIIRLDTGVTVYRIDCKYSPDVYFLNTTLVFFVSTPPWVLGVTYYITMTQGVATANAFCGLESSSANYVNAWRFTIWNPSLTSTTTPSTTTSTATTHTVTTRALGTVAVNTLYTTTGIPAYTTSTTTSTTSTTSTSVTTTTTTSATTTTTSTTTTTKYIPDADVIYPKDFERDCLQPIAIVVTLLAAAFIPLQVFAMTNLFVKVNTNLQKEDLRSRKERRFRVPTPSDLGEEGGEEEEEHEMFV